MKIVFLSDSSFIEPNLSLVKRLKDRCDFHFFIEVRADTINKFGIDRLDRDIINGKLLKELSRYHNYLPLEKTYVIRTLSNKKIIKAFHTSIKVFQLIKKIEPDLIIIDSHNLSVFITELVYGYKSVLIIHDPFLHSGYNKFSINFFRYISFSLVKKKILLNENQRDKFIKINKYKENDVYSSFLSEYEFMRDYPVKKRVDKNKSIIKILFFGIISKYKGVEYLLAAVKDILDEGVTDIYLTIAGSGNFYFDINIYKNYRQINVLNRYIPTDELAQLISDSSVVVCPYIDATQSGVIMTAYALYKPVIVTNVGGLIEMVEHKRTGFIIQSKDKNELKEVILKVYDDPLILDEMSCNIKRKYENECSWEVSSNRFFSIFQDCIMTKRINE